MKNYHLVIHCLAGCFYCWTFAPTVNAQASDTKSKVAELVAITMPGFYTQQKLLAVIANLDPCKAAANCWRAPLPVELLYFTGERLDDQNVLLKWETASEVDNDHFEVERALNPSWGFETVSTIAGRGTTSLNMKYQAPDHNEYDTYSYYRLKQVDLDSSFSYSKIIAIKGGGGPLAVTAFPNPGQAKNIRFRVSGLRQSSNVVISVNDARGVIVYQNPNLAVSPDQDVKINLPNLPAGRYNIKVTAGHRETVTSFVLTP